MKPTKPPMKARARAAIDKLRRAAIGRCIGCRIIRALLRR